MHRPTSAPGLRPLRRPSLVRGTAAAVALASSALLVTPVTAAAAPAPRPAVAPTAASSTASPSPAASSSHPETARGAHGRCRRQLDRAVQSYVDTTQRRDVRAYERLLAPGYTIVLPGGTVFAGRQASETFIERFFARTDWTQTFRQTSRSVDGCRTGLVVLDSVYTDTDGPVPLVVGLTWTREGGRWRLLTDQNTVKDG